MTYINDNGHTLQQRQNNVKRSPWFEGHPAKRKFCTMRLHCRRFDQITDWINEGRMLGTCSLHHKMSQ